MLSGLRRFLSKATMPTTTGTRALKTTLATSLAANGYFAYTQRSKITGWIDQHKPLTSSPKPNPDDTKCLDRTIETGGTTLKEIFSRTEIEDHWIPANWPEPVKRNGPNCGFTALERTLEYGHPLNDGKRDIDIPPSRKDKKNNGDKFPTSLRQIGKARGLTLFGEIFDINAFKTLSDAIGCTGGKAVKLKDNEQEYLAFICHELKKGNTLIVSVDTDWKKRIPGSQEGDGVHWAHVFGFYKDKEGYHFLINTYGAHYTWSGKKLFESNRDLPPSEKMPVIVYSKEKIPSMHPASDIKATEAAVKNGARVVHPNIENYKFTAFVYPSPEMQKSVTLRR